MAKDEVRTPETVLADLRAQLEQASRDMTATLGHLLRVTGSVSVETGEKGSAFQAARSGRIAESALNAAREDARRLAILLFPPQEEETEGEESDEATPETDQSLQKVHSDSAE